jgi:hypothetical protein
MQQIHENGWERDERLWSEAVDAIVGHTGVEARLDLEDGPDDDAYIYMVRFESPHLEFQGVDRDEVLEILRGVVKRRANPVIAAQAVPGIDETIGGTVFLRTSRDVDGIWLYQIRGAIEVKSPFGYGLELEAEIAGLLMIEEKAKHCIADIVALRTILKAVLSHPLYPWESPRSADEIDRLVDGVIYVVEARS